MIKLFILNRSGVYQHYTTAHEGVVVSCKKCHLTFKDYNAMFQHKQICKGKTMAVGGKLFFGEGVDLATVKFLRRGGALKMKNLLYDRCVRKFKSGREGCRYTCILYNDLSLIIIGRKARKIMYLAASVCQSVRLRSHD